jgi:uncharacterized membrane protein (UPF0127 family)
MFMKLIVNDNIFKVKLAVTPSATKKGMMFQEFDDSFDGMYFVMPESGEQCFWMKNCIIPLDIIMVEGNAITKIHHDCPPCNVDDCPNYCGSGNRVIELPGGTCKKLGIVEGQDISLSLF